MSTRVTFPLRVLILSASEVALASEFVLKASSFPPPAMVIFLNPLRFPVDMLPV